jgi:hypothetical protein
LAFHAADAIPSAISGYDGPASLGVRQASIELPKADITFFDGKDCQPNGGIFGSRVANGVPANTCKKPEILGGSNDFKSARARVASIPAGIGCKLTLYKPGGMGLCSNSPETVDAAEEANRCVSSTTREDLNAAFFSCEPLPPPGGYPPADITLYRLPCAVSGIDLAKKEFKKVPANTCRLIDLELLGLISAVSSGRANVAAGQPVRIEPGYRCELVFYRGLFCNRHFPYVTGAAGTCLNRALATTVGGYEWWCGPA